MPTETQLAIYAKILEGSAVRDVLAGQAGGNAQQLSLLNMLTKLCNTPGLLMQSVKAVSLACQAVSTLDDRLRRARVSRSSEARSSTCSTRLGVILSISDSLVCP